MRPSATSVCGLKLLVYAALSRVVGIARKGSKVQKSESESESLESKITHMLTLPSCLGGVCVCVCVCV